MFGPSPRTFGFQICVAESKRVLLLDRFGARKFRVFDSGFERKVADE